MLKEDKGLGLKGLAMRINLLRGEIKHATEIGTHYVLTIPLQD